MMLPTMLQFLSHVSACCLLAFVACNSVANADDPLVLISSFASPPQGGISALTLDPKTGSLTLRHKTVDIPQPFFFDVSPDQRTVYSIFAETFGGSQHEEVAAWSLDPRAGTLQLINRLSSRGTASCFVECDPTGRSLLVANYASGSVISMSLADDGRLSAPVSFVQHTGSSINPERQREPHAHCFVISPDGRYAYAADLGIDQIVCYSLDAATGTLRPAAQPFVRTPPGAGPRHLTFHPNGRCLYVINELSNSVTHYDYTAETGILIERQTLSTLPPDFTGVSYCADLKITPDGKFLYGTNRGHDSVAMYRIGDDGSLTLLGIQPSLGKGPQNLAITRDGGLLLCANMPGNNVAVFRIDAQSGQLTSVGSPLQIDSPSCIRILR